MDLQKTYKSVDAILNTLDFNALFVGFHKFGFALYTSKSICIDGKLIPYRDDFIGNTCISYENELIAIWNIEFDPIDDTELLAYSLVHEMFHCYQRENSESRYPNDLTLLRYPDDTDNYVKKYNENQYLADAYENHDIHSFEKFHTIRNLRLKAYPDMVSQELRTETLEGMAEYVGLKALQTINKDKFQKITADYINKLRLEDKLLFDIRRISYYCGAVYFLCLNAFNIGTKSAFKGEQTAYEQNAPLFSNSEKAEILPYPSISEINNEMQAKKRETVKNHIAKSKFIACDAYICGYDPMNMFQTDDIIYCSHFVFLNKEGKTEMIRSAVALKLKSASSQEINGYYI